MFLTLGAFLSSERHFWAIDFCRRGWERRHRLDFCDSFGTKSRISFVFQRFGLGIFREFFRIIPAVGIRHIFPVPTRRTDDVGVFRSTISSVIKSQFPTVGTGSIEVLDVPLSVDGLSSQNLIQNCAIPNSTGGIFGKTALWPIIASQDQNWTKSRIF